MFNKLKIHIKNLKNKIFKFNEKYSNQLFFFSLINLIFIKINNIFFNINYLYICLLIIIITLIFSNRLFFPYYHKLINSFIFNWILFYFFVFKDKLYNTIFLFFDIANYQKYDKLFVFFFILNFSNILLSFIFFLLKHSMNFSILILIFSLFFGVFDLIEKKVINNSKNIGTENLDYIQVKRVLKINNLSFKKNKPFLFIQKRYAKFHIIKDQLKKYTAHIIAGLTVTSVTQIYLIKSDNENFNKNLKIKQDELDFNCKIKQDELDFNCKIKQEELDFNCKIKQEELDFQKEKFALEKKKFEFEKFKEYNNDINNLNTEIIKSGNNGFFNKMDPKKIEALVHERDFIKQQRIDFKNSIEKENINLKINNGNNNDLFDD
jgi:hypothetical protein